MEPSDTDHRIAIITLAIEAGVIVGHVGSMAHDAYRNRAAARRCRLQAELDELMALVRQAPPDAVDSFAAAADADACIEKIQRYIEDMDRGSLVSEALEVMWYKRYAKILADSRDVRHWYLVGLRARPVLQQPVLLPDENGKLRPHATIYHKDLESITFQDENRSKWRGHLGEYGDVVCYRLQDNKYSAQSLEAFPRLQRRAYVQQLKGLAKINEQFYVFMQDCSGFDTLNKLCIEGTLPADLESRVEIALKVAQTVAWYHQSNLVVKVIQDTSIVVQVDKENRGHATPILTDLDHIRDLYERTSGVRLDCRYEAPEYIPKRPRTFYSDVWSLGIVVWQIICGGHPYGVHTYVDSNNRETVAKLREKIKSDTEPGKFSADVPQDLAIRLIECWDHNPLRRPDARTVAGWLMDAWLLLLSGQAGVTRPLGARPSDDGLLIADGEVLAHTKDQVGKLVNQHRTKAPSSGGAGIRETVSAATTQGKIGTTEVMALLLSYEAGNIESAFLLGAGVWWEALDEDALRLLSGNVVDDEANNDDGFRAELALKFLRKAVRGGWKDAYLEMSLAMTFLSQMFKLKHDEMKTSMARVASASAAGAKRA